MTAFTPCMRHFTPVLQRKSTMALTNSPARTELVSIQLLRALASLLVLLAHLQIKERQYGNANALIWQDFRIGSIGVDIFFVLSGFIIFYVAGRTPSTGADAWKFMKNRFIRVLPLYWALSVIALIIFLTQPELVNKSSSKVTAIWESFLLIPTDNKLLIQNGWTLSYEFLFYFAFFVAILLLPLRFRVQTLLLAAFSSVFIGVLIEPSSTFLRFVTDDLLLEFAYGVLIAAIYQRLDFQTYFKATWGSAAAFAALTTVVFLAYVPPAHGSLRGIHFGVPAALLVFAALALEKELSRLAPLKILGDSSYSLYLSHVLTLPAAGMIWVNLGLNATLSNMWLLIYLFIVSVGASIVLYQYFELPLTNLLRKRFR